MEPRVVIWVQGGVVSEVITDTYLQVALIDKDVEQEYPGQQSSWFAPTVDKDRLEEVLMEEGLDN